MYSKLGNHIAAIKDCETALRIDPFYSKAYGRLGLAYSSLNDFQNAKENYAKALELEPDNESFKNNLYIAENKLSQSGAESNNIFSANNSNIDLSLLLSNPALMSMARQMLSDPAMQNMMTNIISGNSSNNEGMTSLIEA